MSGATRSLRGGRAGRHMAGAAVLVTAALIVVAGGLQAQEPVDPAAALEELQTTVLSTGPSGESPTAPTEVVLTEEELAAVAEMDATAAIVMHYGGNDWSRRRSPVSSRRSANWASRSSR